MIELALIVALALAAVAGAVVWAVGSLEGFKRALW